MNRTLESLLRFVNLTASGLLAGSLGFGESALTPGWEQERARELSKDDEDQVAAYFNAIGPIALVSAIALAVGVGNKGRSAKLLDTVSAVGQAGVLATTTLLTVPLNQKLETRAPVDYPRSDAHALVKKWSRAHAVRTGLGVTAFLCAVAATASRR